MVSSTERKSNFQWAGSLEIYACFLFSHWLKHWLDCEESWVLKNWCFWTVVLEKTLESPLDCKEIEPVHPKKDQPWVFIGRTDAKAETPILWPPHVKSWLIGKDSDTGRDWGQEKKGMTEDEMAGWHHWLDGREFEWALGVGDGQGGLACCASWGRKESDTTERLNWKQCRWCGMQCLKWLPVISVSWYLWLCVTSAPAVRAGPIDLLLIDGICKMMWHHFWD